MQIDLLKKAKNYDTFVANSNAEILQMLELFRGSVPRNPLVDEFLNTIQKLFRQKLIEKITLGG